MVRHEKGRVATESDTRFCLSGESNEIREIYLHPRTSLIKRSKKQQIVAPRCLATRSPPPRPPFIDIATGRLYHRTNGRRIDEIPTGEF